MTLLPQILQRLVSGVFIPAVLFTAASAGAQPGMTRARYLVLFQQRCATCHGVGGAAPRAASLEALRALSPERVYEALAAGSMAVNAAERPAMRAARTTTCRDRPSWSRRRAGGTC